MTGPQPEDTRTAATSPIGAFAFAARLNVAERLSLNGPDRQNG